MTGDEAFLAWGQENPTEFYRLYGKMIPTTLELPEDLHEDFIDELIFEEEERRIVDVEAEALPAPEMGDNDQKQAINGANTPQIVPDNSPPNPMMT